MVHDENKPNYKLERWITLILALLFLIPFIARAQEAEPGLPEPITLDQVKQGSLLLKTDKRGLFIPAPTLHTDVQIRVSGMIARARVIQQFQNPSSQCVEAIYVFPLPENAAVDQLFMTISNRRIEGQIKEREEARQVYEQAKSEGKKASLLEQQRPNIFIISVASILPGEKPEIEIQYQQIVDYRDGEFRLRFPTLVAPRYTPGEAVGGQRTAGGGPRVPEEFPTFADLRTVSNTLTAGRGPLTANPVNLKIELNSGIPLRRVASSYHSIRNVPLSAGNYEVTLADGDVPADRDFELVWQPDIGSEPRAAVFSETLGGESYGLVMLLPPTEQATPVRLPRETVYIIDTSGSMSGASMQQAEEALVLALRGLDSRDTFNVIEFDSDTNLLFDQSRPADPAAIATAIQFVEALEADEGTEMLPAIAAALRTSSVSDGRVRQVIFMTDGQVGNEDQIFEHIHAHLGNSRLFTVGIGSAPNSHFMRRAAEIGRGTFTYIGDLNEVKEKMGALFRKLDNPVLSDVQLRFDDPVAEAWPARIPDLYVGEPLLVTVKLGSVRGGVSAQGKVSGGMWNEPLSLSGGTMEAGIGKLWARRKIESLDDSVTAGADPQQVRNEIVTTALHHHLVSQHTSLVAVDVTPTGLDASRCTSQLLPLNEPKGWTDPGVPGSLPQTATPGRLLLILGLLFLVVGVVLHVAHR